MTTVTVYGEYFSPFKGVSVLLFDPASKEVASTSAVVQLNGGFQASIKIPLLAPIGTATIKACDTNSLCAYTTISVT